jgi:hypothetical protein
MVTLHFKHLIGKDFKQITAFFIHNVRVKKIQLLINMFQQNYLASNILKINQNNTYYTYTVIKVGFYPSNNILYYTSARSTNQFKIPNE